jgi:hypothetical protein
MMEMLRHHRTPWMAVLLCLCMFLGGRAAVAQVDTGALLGTVKDASGAVIPNAKVTLINEGTSLTLTMTTRGDGSYIFTPLKIGTYTVEAEAPGFEKGRNAGVVVNIQQQVVVDFTLVPGAVTQTVEVTSQAPLLQTQNGSVGQVVNSTAINDLPLNGRNFNFLARLTAGVTVGQEEGRSLNSNGWFAANGTRPAQNDLLLDGIDNNSDNVDFLNGAAYVVKPPVDALSEFKLQTNSFNAEFGRAGGAVLNATVKSGSNQIHGDAWEFVRNDKFDAADFFQDAAGESKGEFRQNQFGGTIGGPIRKNKTFWFADYEGTRIRQATPWLTSVPTAAEASSGFTDFTDLISGQTGVAGTDLLGRTFKVGTILDPATTRSVTAGQVDPVTGMTATGSGFVRDQIQCNGVPNTICANRLDPNAIKLLQLFPTPTASGLFSNYSSNPIGSTNVNQFDVRIDQNFSDKDQLFVRYSFYDSPTFSPGPFTGYADGGGFNNGDQKSRPQGAAVSWTHSFSPTVINEARIGWTRESVVRTQAYGNDTNNIPGQFGIQGIPQESGNGGLPYFGIGGLSQLGSAEWLVSSRYSRTFQITDNLTKIYGSHSFKGGVEIQQIQFPWIAPPYSRGEFDYGGGYTAIPNVGDSSTGRAQFVLSPAAATYAGGVSNLGGPNNVNASNFGYLNPFKNYYGIYFQDDWKVTPKLTLNLGLRWDYFGLVGDKFNAQGNFVPGKPFSTAEFVMDNAAKSVPLSPSFTTLLTKDGINLVYTNAYGKGLGTAQDTNFAPRLGFAYRFTPKLVLRGGYGIYYGGFENRGGDPALGYNYPFQYAFSFPSANSQTSVTYPDGQQASLERGFLDIPLNPSLVQASGLAFRGIQLHYITPYVQGYNLTGQYELTPNDSFEVGYVASLGRHIETFSSTNDVAEILPPGTNPQQYVPYPDFSRGANYATTNSNSDYHSMQAKYDRRLTKGLDMLAALTWGMTRTNANDLLSGGGIASFRAPYLPNFGIEHDMGLASYDIRKALSWSGTYQLPFGHGQHFGASTSKLEDGVLGGWMFNWIMTMDDGQPLTLNCVTNGTSGLGCYALETGAAKYAGPHNVNQWMNPAAFADPAPATTIGQSNYGPLGGGPTQIIGPGFHRLDYSLFKQFQTTERTRLEFRAEFFNITNHPNFSVTNMYTNYKSTSTFGRITATRDSPNDPRQIQFALKFYF